MNKAADLTQERASTQEKYRGTSFFLNQPTLESENRTADATPAFLAAEASLKKKLAVEKIEKDVNAVFSSVAADFEGECKSLLGPEPGLVGE